MHFISLLLPWAVLACTHCIIYFPNWKQFFSDPRTTCWYRKHILIPIFSWSGLQWSFVKLHTCNRPVSATVLSMTVGPKLRFFFFFFLFFFTKMTSWCCDKVQFWTNLLVKRCDKIHLRSWSKLLSMLLSCIGLLYKVAQKIGHFSNYVLHSFSRTDLKNRQLESTQTWHDCSLQHLVPKRCWGFLIFGLLPIFFSLSPKTARFCTQTFKSQYRPVAYYNLEPI